MDTEKFKQKYEGNIDQLKHDLCNTIAGLNEINTKISILQEESRLYNKSLEEMIDNLMQVYNKQLPILFTHSGEIIKIDKENEKLFVETKEINL